MKKIFLFFIFVTYAFSCEGDCIACHSSLSKNGVLDTNHSIMTSCKDCHENTPQDFQKMGVQCGQDCWDCHNVDEVMSVKKENKTIKEHVVLNSCINCHTSLKDDINSLFLRTQIDNL